MHCWLVGYYNFGLNGNDGFLMMGVKYLRGSGFLSCKIEF